MNSAAIKTPSIESSEIFPGIRRITLNQHVYSYLITGSERSFLIDTGWGMSDLRACVESVSDAPLTVVNTHGHFDHTYGNYQFERVHISDEDLPLALHGYRSDARLEMLRGYDTSCLPGGMSAEGWISAPHPETDSLYDHELFDLGGRKIEVISSPGHTAGSVCFLDREEGILFSGDTIYKGYLLLHFDSSTALSVYRDSLQKICSLRSHFSRILPSHGRVPLDSSFAEDVLNGVDQIIQGKCSGESHLFRGRRCRIASFGGFFIVYKDPD